MLQTVRLKDLNVMDFVIFGKGGLKGATGIMIIKILIKQIEVGVNLQSIAYMQNKND